MDGGIVKKIFGGFLIISGIIELFSDFKLSKLKEFWTKVRK